MPLTRLLGFIGATVGGALGWWLGARQGVMTGYIVSTIGTGLGIYAGVRIARRYLS